MSLVKSFVQVEYISPNRELLDSWQYAGFTWNKKDNWSLSIPVDAALLCAKCHGAFKVYWPTESVNDISQLSDRVKKLEERQDRFEFGTLTDNGDARQKRRGRPPKEMKPE